MKDSRLQREKGDNRMGSNCFLFFIVLEHRL